MSSAFRQHLLPLLVWFVYRCWSLTWRVTKIHPPELDVAMQSGQPLIFAHWHGDELALVSLVTKYRIATMTSTSKDGQLIDYVIRRLGGATSKGSSTRGGVSALKGMVRLLCNGYRGSMAVDGPKGPIHSVKPGVFELSRLANAPIIPTGVGYSWPYVFKKSWNQAHLPLPFSRVTVWFGKPMSIINREDDVHAPALAKNLALQISDAVHQASKHIASF